MTYNTIAYLIFITLTLLITAVVGHNLHKNGAVFLKNLFKKDQEIMLNINNVLLAGYYLLNVGFALYTLTAWTIISSTNELISLTTRNLSILTIGLGLIHFCNLIAFLITAKIKKVNL